jgi:hypothetical protein
MQANKINERKGWLDGNEWQIKRGKRSIICRMSRTSSACFWPVIMLV